MRKIVSIYGALLAGVMPMTALAQETTIAAPTSDSGAIVREAPEDDLTPPPQSGAQRDPAMQESTTQPTLPPRPLTQAEMDTLRKGMVDRSEGMILRPKEVGKLRDATLGMQSAAVRPTYSTDPYPISEPRVVKVEKTPMMTPPTVRLAYGLHTPVTFVDSDGFPWPISLVTYNPAMIAQDGNGCGASNNSTGTPDGQRPTTIALTPCFFEIFGNINVSLDKWPYPVVLVVQSGFRPDGSGSPIKVDVPLTVVIDGRSPLAERVPAINVAKAGRGGAAIARANGAKKKSKKPVVSGDDDLADYIVGRPPRSASSVSITGARGVRAYLAGNGDLVVVGRAEVLAPNFAKRASTPDGETAYRFNGAPYRVLFGYKSGEEVAATVRF